MKGTFRGFILREELAALKDQLNTYSGLTTLLGLTYDTRKEAENDLGDKDLLSDVLGVAITAEIRDDGDEGQA